MKRGIWKSIGAVVAGLATIIVLSNGTDTILETTGVFPPLQEQLEHGFTVPWMAVLAVAYRNVFTVLGGYVTAWLTPKQPLRHVLTLAAANIVPAWFSVALLVLGPCCAWLGGTLQQREAHPKRSAGFMTTKGEAR